MFPFVLTFCGVSLIYLGIYFDREGVADLFAPVLNTANQGNVLRWTQQLSAALDRLVGLAA